MQHYSLSEIALMYGKPLSTTHDHIQKLKKKKKFKKKSEGRYYNEDETKLVAALLNFPYKPRPQKKAA